MIRFRVVLDTNVLVAALRSASGASRRLLLALPDQRFSAIVSVPLFLEYEAALKREELLKATKLSLKDSWRGPGKTRKRAPRKRKAAYDRRSRFKVVAISSGETGLTRPPARREEKDEPDPLPAG